MKRIGFLLILLTTILLGCEHEKQTTCSDLGSAQISWTNYNLVDSVIHFFQCQPDSILQHRGDTIKVVGWLYLEDSIYHSYWDCRLAGSKNYQGDPYKGTLKIAFRDRFNIWGDTVYYNNPLEVIGTLDGGKIDIAMGEDCCDYYFYINSIDTINIYDR
jgi:hypothetical protein